MITKSLRALQGVNFKCRRASLLLISVALISGPCAQLVWSKKASRASSNQTAVDKTVDLSKTASALGLSPADLTLINQGRWKDVENALSLSAKRDKNYRTTAWLAFTYMFRNNCDQLRALSEESKTLPQDDVNVILIQAFELLCEKKFNEAEKFLQSIPASAMQDAFVNFAFAAVAGKQGKAAAAITYTQRATDLAPEFAWGYRTLGFLQRQWLKDYDQAERSYAKAFAIEPLFTDAANALIDLRLRHNDFDQAIDVAQAQIQNSPKEPENHDRLAQIYIKQWRLRDALKELREAIALAPENPKYYRSKASILQYQGNLSEAIEDEQKAVNLSNNKVFDLLELASLESSAGRENGAVEHIEQALAIEPGNIKAGDQLELLLIKSARFDDLVAELKLLIDKDKANEILHIRLGNALAAAGKLEQAVDAYKEAANRSENDPEPHRKIGALRIAQRDYGAAAREYTRALNINANGPNSIPDLVALGYCYGQTDDYLQAEAAFVTALALHQLTQAPDSTVPPTRQDILRALATFLFEEGRYADAASQFATICSMNKASEVLPLDQFMLAQATALRDRSSASFNTLIEAFEKLPEIEKKQQEINLVDTLLRGDRIDEAIKYLSKLDPAVASDLINNGVNGNTSLSAAANESIVNKSPEAKEVDRKALIYICWSRAFRAKHDLERAERAAKQAIAISGQDGTPLSDAFSALGEVNLEKGNLDEAIKNATSALQANLKSFRAYDLLGKVSLKNRMYKDAIVQAEKALQLDPYFSDGYLLEGRAQAASNDLKGAYLTFQKAVNLYPGYVKAHEELLAVLRKLDKIAEAKQEESTIAQLKSRQ